jgi:hypothetical protein
LTFEGVAATFRMRSLSVGLLLVAVLVGPLVATAQRQPSTTLEVEGRLTALSTGPGFRCGNVGWAIAARYEVVRTVFGQPPGPVVFVLSPCGSPSDARIGALQRLELTQTNVGHLAVFDDFPNEAAPRLWLVRSTPAAP